VIESVDKFSRQLEWRIHTGDFDYEPQFSIPSPANDTPNLSCMRVESPRRLQLDADHLLFVATDRISAFDYVLATGIRTRARSDPDFAVWFDFLEDTFQPFRHRRLNRYRGDSQPCR